jgi:hypothetical protein
VWVDALSDRFYTPTLIRPDNEREGWATSHKSTWVAATSTTARCERRDCGGLLRGVMIMKRIALAVLALAVLGIGLTLALAPARAFIMTLTDENGGCTFSAGAMCGGVLAPAPSTGLVTGDVLTYVLPSLVFTGRVLITEPDGITPSDVLQWYCVPPPGRFYLRHAHRLEQYRPRSCG